MPNDCISYQKSGYFSKLIVDYLDEKPELKALYNRFPKLENFKPQIEEKAKNFTGNRQTLVSALENQYRGFEISETTKTNISLLSDNKTFTITTGHQLNLFTGPLYFLYKIISVINLCQELKQAYPDYNFVPIYWMATEDHDFEEINYFHFKNVKIQWDRESFGPVGRLSTAGLEEVYEVFAQDLGLGDNANYLKSLFDNSYLKYSNLADATRFLANELFGQKGLVILDGDDVALKQLFTSYAKEELLHQTSFQNVTKTNELLRDYTIQVNPREINLFYIEDNLRERLVFEDNQFKVNNTNLVFSESEILTLLESNPEKFSPNVILRPLYQEVILPNLCYIGGGGEIAYWLQLKANFEANQVTFPILLVRNSVVLATEKQLQKADKLNLSWSDLFSNQQDLFNKKTQEFSQFNLDFTEQKEHLKKQFATLHQMASQTDKSFGNAVKAQEVKQLKGLENLEKRLLKAEKKNHAEKLERILQLQNELFPNQSLQERRNNFSEFYLDFGNDLIQKLLNELKPLEQTFTISIL
ncbi:bacillithiol biosynthesis cysteine-adding enzyme BshC [Flavobacterium sp. J49]|uniref:bacillithiol biosynthesis cysteine-adding enzyme BshC n=1 Tax=Flavobacterium sp. J49 TaxID=2718534 RepID=UPI0015941ADE|nr:bacillithiol biosynthesis cysteine-adding enzyme BshC [Flavobacterium sp. J49]MBF6640677.1 bacillithiol biosynthesis cysteine-adding enzyme BshC [Flavobacterium sp. J49]NIC01924.1 bacillithiol biosynthesis cysteine-adding enzyme BshC [Flavobacterium sp. J49]